MKRLLKYLPAVTLAAAAVPMLRRDLWFDEALTLLQFAALDSPARIYHNYVIPNNHIFYTVMLSWWNRLNPGLDPVFHARALSLLFAAGTILMLQRMMRKRLYSVILLAATAVSVPFCVYATAVRGYMAGAFFITAAVTAGKMYAVRGKIRAAALYTAASLAAVATLPSNLAALAAVWIWLAPYCRNKKQFTGRMLPLAIIPPAAFLIFYLPIRDNFMQVLQLGEGWNSGWKSGMAVCAALASGYLPLALCIPAAVCRRYSGRAVRQLVWLIPLPMFFMFKAAPFPRVFFPFLPVFLLLFHNYAGRFCAKFRRHGIIIAAMLTAAALFPLAPRMPAIRERLSEISGGAYGDDYFYGYYLRPEHSPEQTVRGIAETYGPGTQIYASFAADPWALAWYAGMLLPESEFQFDSPRGAVNALETGTLLILNRKENTESYAARFKGKLNLLFANGEHSVYEFMR